MRKSLRAGIDVGLARRAGDVMNGARQSGRLSLPQASQRAAERTFQPGLHHPLPTYKGRPIEADHWRLA